MLMCTKGVYILAVILADDQIMAARALIHGDKKMKWLRVAYLLAYKTRTTSTASPTTHPLSTRECTTLQH